jgi:two-component sensor histidine kinase
VKNTLATVQSIAAQTARTTVGGTVSPDAPDAFLDRLMALSRAHDVLTRESWEGAVLSAIVQGAVQPFEAAPGERFRISGPETWLEPQPALALAMALHELATNASKYGALSQAGGRVSIEWMVRPQAPDAELELCWREEGGPPVTPPTRKGFGSRLIGRAMRDLQPSCFSYAVEGVRCEFTVRVQGGSD